MYIGFLNRVMLLQMKWDYDINQMLYRFYILVSPLQPFFRLTIWLRQVLQCVVFVKKIWHLLSSQRCMTIEQMNSGSVQNWLDKEMLSPQAILGRLMNIFVASVGNVFLCQIALGTGKRGHHFSNYMFGYQSRVSKVGGGQKRCSLSSD